MSTELFGQIQGLSTSDLKGLERLYRRKLPFDVLTTPELTKSLAEVSFSIRRQVGVIADRNGEIRFVVVGDANKLFLPDLGRFGSAAGRFRGLRLLHTHLRNEPLTRDDIVDLTRLRLDMITALCLGPEGLPTTVYYGYCVVDSKPGSPSPTKMGSNPARDSRTGMASSKVGATADVEHTLPYRQVGPIPYHHVDVNPAEIILALEEESARSSRKRAKASPDGRAILLHVASRTNSDEVTESIRELRELARTAGVEVADVMIQSRPQPDPKYVLGKGKLEDVVLRAMQVDADLLIFDRELAASQAAAIAALTDLRVIDRTQLILDIFARRAESRDGKLQVELAQMKYLLPRLGQKDDSLSRLTGGIGGRGPGETKLEIGKRRARERIGHLEHLLKHLSRQRVQRRQRRHRREVPVMAIVGYTNAGKSTLLNSLTGSSTLVEDKLFATLDTRARRIRFPREREVVVTDTVGFIRRLPKDLFAAFRATFEEAQDADLLLQVVDASDAASEEHMETTEALLVELGLERVPRLVVLNKSDATDPDHLRSMVQRLNGVAVSALDSKTLVPLLERLETMLFDVVLVSDTQEVPMEEDVIGF